MHVPFCNWTLINDSLILCLCLFILVFTVELLYYFGGATPWYQSLPGLNSLGTWEVVFTTMGLSRLIEIFVCMVCYVITCLCDSMVL